MLFVKRCGVLLVVWACVYPAAVSRAQEDSANLAQPDAGRAEFEAGVRFYEEGQWASALEQFRRSRELSGRAMLDLNIAQCLFRIGNWHDAVGYFDRFIGTGEDDALQEEARAQRARILSEAAQLTLDGWSEGDALQVDDASLEFPSSTILLAPGAHSVLVRRDGEAPWEASLQAALGERLTRTVGETGTTAPDREVDGGVDEPEGNRFGALPWVSMGAGISMAGAGVALMFAAMAKRRSLESPEMGAVYQPSDRRAYYRRNRLGGALLPIGLGAIGVAILLNRTGRRAGERDAESSPVSVNGDGIAIAF